ncbi:MAG TPA: hypothetical protein VF753_20135 [Terriglobales bacterium]
MRVGRFLLASAVVAAMAVLSACGGGNGSSSSGGNNPPPPANTDIVYTFIGSNPTAIAMKIGTGSWAGATVSTNNQFTVSVPSGTSSYGLAYVCAATTGETESTESVIEATVSDGNAFTVFGCSATGKNLGLITGSVSTYDYSFINYQGSLWVWGAQGNEVSLPYPQQLVALGAPNGTNDIAIVAMSSLVNAAAVKIVRNQTVPGTISGSPVTLAPSDVVVSKPYLIHNIPPGFGSSSIYSEYYTANGTYFILGSGTSTQYLTVPPSQMQPGDYTLLSASASAPPSPQNINQGVFEAISITSPGTMNFKMPAPLPYVPPTAAAWPTFTLKYPGFSGVTASDEMATMNWSLPGADNFNSVSVVATSAYQAGATTLAVPDLTSLNGFLPPPPSGTMVEWYTQVSGGNYHAFLQAPANASLSGATAGGFYNAP